MVIELDCTFGVWKNELLLIEKIFFNINLMKTMHNTLRGWLLENNYDDILKTIDDILIEWQHIGNKQRRNWWDVLAGDKDGKSRIISGREIPVLKAAQIRKGVKVTENAICRDENENLPIPINANNKWQKNRN